MLLTDVLPSVPEPAPGPKGESRTGKKFASGQKLKAPKSLTGMKKTGGADGIVAAQYVDEKTPVFAGLIVASPLKSPQERAALGGPPRNSSPDGFGM